MRADIVLHSIYSIEYNSYSVLSRSTKMGTLMNKEQYVIDDHGRKTAIILPVKEYDKMLQDIHDLAVVAERRREGTITLADMKKRMKKSGLL